ncbi:DUF2076 domain-containing protein [Magnetospirillum molischianum]|nr:DUF2076 domain-containing protein [Magnetospirillum molischianum]
MTPQERSLIQSVFDRLARLAGSPKDSEAEALILASIRQIPDAPYQLVQAVVVQEQALNEADARIAELQRQLAEAQAQARTAQPAQQPASGGLFSGINPWGRSRVPQTPAAPAPGYAPAPPPGFGGGQPAYPQPPQSSPWGGGAPSAGGSFLRTAAGTAVGVAGGVMLAQGLSSMFGGSHAAAAAAPNVPPAADPAAAAPVSYDTQVADTGGYDAGGDYTADGFDGGFDDSSY